MYTNENTTRTWKLTEHIKHGTTELCLDLTFLKCKRRTMPNIPNIIIVTYQELTSTMNQLRLLEPSSLQHILDNIHRKFQHEIKFDDSELLTYCCVMYLHKKQDIVISNLKQLKHEIIL